MLVYAAEFPLKPGVDLLGFLELAKEWLAGSPNNRWSIDELETPDLSDLVVLKEHGESVEIGLVEFEEESIAALRYRWEEQGKHTWTTELLGRFAEKTLWASVRLSCDALAAGQRLPRPKKPHVVKQLLEKCGGAKDGPFKVDDKPRYLRETDLHVVAEVVKGKSNNQLPVVYVSAGYSSKPHVDPQLLAKRLSGQAHVLVEPSRAFSIRLQHEVDGDNAYGGALGVYWPGSSGVSFRLLPGASLSNDMVRQVEDSIRRAFCNYRPSPGATWADVQGLLFRKRIAQLRASGSKELEEYVDLYDSELAAKNSQIDELRHELDRLRAEMRAMSAASPRGEASLLARGSEQDLFPGEVLEIVVACLRDKLNKSKRKSRVYHVLEDLLEKNRLGNRRGEMAEAVKSILGKTKRIGQSEIAKLVDLGFEASAAGKHWKIRYGGDERYTFSVPKTPSDHRSGKNCVSSINSMLFK